MDGLRRYKLCNEYIELKKVSPLQKSMQWILDRMQCITASDIHNVTTCTNFDGKSISSLIKSKTKNNKVTSNFSSNMYTRWGEKYEYTSVQIYEKMFNVKIYESGLLINRETKIGASCDGLIPLTTNVVGTESAVDTASVDAECIEIKNPYCRVLGEGVYPPSNYVSQMQAQLYVTQFEVCNFFDCKTEEWGSENEFLNDINAYLNSTDQSSDSYYGVIAQFVDKSNEYNVTQIPEELLVINSSEIPMDTIDPDCNYNITPYHIYSELINSDFSNYAQVCKDLKSKVAECKKNSNMIFIRYYYWKLVDYRHVRVQRDPNWYNKNKPKFDAFWEAVERMNNVCEEQTNTELIN
jgi:hypothetical protein